MKRFIRYFTIFWVIGFFVDLVIVVYFYKKITSLNIVLNSFSFFLIFFTLLSFIFGIVLSRRQELTLKFLREVIEDLKGSKEPKFPSFNDKELVRLFFEIKEIYRILKKNTESVENERKKLEFVVDSVEDGIILLSENRIDFVNSRAKDMLRLNENNEDIINALPSHVFIEVFEEILKKGNLEKEIEVDGRWLLFKSKCLGDKRVVIVRDITREKNYAVLKYKFFEDASHELKTPITSILGYSETLLSEELDRELMRKFLVYINESAKNLSELVDDILTLHRLEKQKEPASGACNLENVLDELEIAFSGISEGKGINFVVENNLEKVGLPCSYVKSILWNLVDNALKYTEKGFVKVKCYKKDDIVVFKVEDSGIGIDKKHLPYIFDRFYTTQIGRDRRISGTGLGLSIVKHIVQLYGGSIDVDSEPFKGSVFTVKLPVS